MHNIYMSRRPFRIQTNRKEKNLLKFVSNIIVLDGVEVFFHVFGIIYFVL